ncbi:exported protein of unknown function [Nitrosotalea devaniterrae]|uniref:Uncharacterized protein n=1 Tax=Nitrosotalea devaniterrae TaxID=1078905 RepID=A0A128A3J0_9ARCH|nr:exported protein of unknown function [Candidatus Nitrosotalea devanaterra]
MFVLYWTMTIKSSQKETEKKQMNGQTYRKILLASAISIILILPNTMILQSNAATVQHSHPELPSNALALQQKIDEQTDIHPDWIGILDWNSTGAEIKYLGPAKSNPFKVDPSKWHHTPILVNETRQTTVSNGKQASVSPLVGGTYRPVKVYDSIYWHYNLGGNSIYEITDSYTLTTSNVSGVDLFHWLDAKTSTTGYWPQVSAVYDYANFFGFGQTWSVAFDLWNTGSCTEPAGFPFTTTHAFTTGSTATGYIRADSTTAGKYYMGVTSGGSGASTTFTISGDTGHNIDVGYTTGGGCQYPSGSEVEETASTNTAIYYYGTLTYNYSFYDTSTSSANSYVYSYNGKGGFGGNVSPSATPGTPSSMTYTCYFNAPYCP